LLTALQTAGAFGKSNILGTVSQLAGVPTGAVIEYNSNANGAYVKWADGTMICTATIDNSTMAVTSAIGSIFQAGQEATWTYPATFVGTPLVFPSPNRNDGSVIFGVFMRLITGTSAQYRLWSATSYAAGNVKYTQLLAMGRWF
jgi:hypothetical protein